MNRDRSGADAAAVEAYLAALPDAQRAALQALRAVIAAAAPEAVDGISYGMPAFRYRGRPLVSYAAFKAHCSFFPMGSQVLEVHRDRLAGFLASKGTLHFTPDRPLPADVVVEIVRARVAALDARR